MIKRQDTLSDKLDAAAARRAAEEAAYRKLHGNLLPDVEFLRKRGFTVIKVRGGHQVGNKVLDREGLQAMAARERRVAGEDHSTVRKVVVTASGLRVGDSVPIGDRG